ncbi:MAG: glycoside hydrolase family 99-like domain-containing protein, partial [Rhizobium leguminosarum]
IPPFKLYRGIIPSWDNTARRQNTSTTVVNANPELYGEWLRYLRAYTRLVHQTAEDNFVFINAWNEWGEGCHLEPDQKWGLSYLDETSASSFYDADDPAAGSIETARESLLTKVSRLARVSDPRLAEDFAKSLTQYRQPSQTARRLSGMLLRWPWLHRMAKRIYSRTPY